MRYLGGKAMVAKHIVPTLLKYRGKRTWVEPFVGAASIICRVTGHRIGSDNNPYLISLLKAVQGGWKPPIEITKEQYQDIKQNKDQYPPELVGFAGFACAYGGKWFDAYARETPRYSAKGERKLRNYVLGSRKSLLKKATNFDGIDFRCCDYTELDIPDNSFIYCDPPYAGTTKLWCKFDNDKFWQWCRDKNAEGHVVIVSEYAAPDDFECILEHSKKCGVAQHKVSNRVERLFMYKG